ncbi:RNA chaperone Hfq [Bacillus sp. XF8]|nr:RNA chaperone Hfq [Bacillus sp. XF8]
MRGYFCLNFISKLHTVFLKSGVRVTGQILAIDKFTILMTVHGKQQLGYKQVVSTITI